jgi:hypothetical protein
MNAFFANSLYLDTVVVRPLSHILSNWELIWDRDKERYCEEKNSYAVTLNQLFVDLSSAKPPSSYHDNEDRLAEYVVGHLKWSIRKEGKRWVGADYAAILEQSGFHDTSEQDLVIAAAGRIQAAVNRNQFHFDDMEESHRRMLGAVITIILYHRTPFHPSDEKV